MLENYYAMLGDGNVDSAKQIIEMIITVYTALEHHKNTHPLSSYRPPPPTDNPFGWNRPPPPSRDHFDFPEDRRRNIVTPLSSEPRLDVPRPSTTFRQDPLKSDSLYHNGVVPTSPFSQPEKQSTGEYLRERFG